MTYDDAHLSLLKSELEAKITREKEREEQSGVFIFIFRSNTAKAVNVRILATCF